MYLRWTERELLALSPLVRLLWGSFIDELITAYDRAQGKDCQPVLLLIDEAGRTAIPSLADHATTVVGRGISLWIAIQSLSQLDTVYGRPRAHILRDNIWRHGVRVPTVDGDWHAALPAERPNAVLVHQLGGHPL